MRPNETTTRRESMTSSNIVMLYNTVDKMVDLEKQQTKYERTVSIIIRLHFLVHNPFYEGFQDSHFELTMFASFPPTQPNALCTLCLPGTQFL